VGALQYNAAYIAADVLVNISPQLFLHFWFFAMNPGMLQKQVWHQTRLQSSSTAACVLVTVQWVRCSTTHVIVLQMTSEHFFSAVSALLDVVHED
jgi:hypothetical protein